MKAPLIIVSGLKSGEAERVLPRLASLQRPLYLEATSRLKGHPQLAEWEIVGGEESVKRMKFDGVIRIGSVPTLRFWRDLESLDLPVWNFTRAPFSGLARPSELRAFEDLSTREFSPWNTVERELDRNLAIKRERLLREFPLSELGWFQWLGEQIPRNARLFLGNSLPIREWDFAGSAVSDVYANRGTNGIDGLISTFAGVADPAKSNWAIVGDLSALYDLSGPWALKQRPINNFNLVVINNGGGQIFHRMFHDPMFLNEHGLRFKGWAEMFGFAYNLLEEPAALTTGRPQVIEIVPSARQTEDFWRKWETL